MTCEELLRQLTEYEDGVLPDDVCEELQRHQMGATTEPICPQVPRLTLLV